MIFGLTVHKDTVINLSLQTKPPTARNRTKTALERGEDPTAAEEGQTAGPWTPTYVAYLEEIGPLNCCFDRPSTHLV